MKTAILSGPTATGKSGFALEFARRHPQIEIVNADSMLVYRGMDIGTAKPTAAERSEISHHLVDIRDPDEAFTAGDFVRETDRVLRELEGRGKRALIVGGTGFYLKALLYGLWETPPSDPALRAKLEEIPSPELYARLEKRDSQAALRIGVNDRYRLIRAIEMIELGGKSPSELRAEAPTEPDPRFELFVIDRETDELEERISSRVDQMLEAGLIDEVRGIRETHPGARALSAVGYAETCEFLDGQKPKGRKVKAGQAGLRDEIILATRQLVKRQRTWFRAEKSAKTFVLDRDRAALEHRLRDIYGDAS